MLGLDPRDPLPTTLDGSPDADATVSLDLGRGTEDRIVTAPTITDRTSPVLALGPSPDEIQISDGRVPSVGDRVVLVRAIGATYEEPSSTDAGDGGATGEGIGLGDVGRFEFREIKQVTSARSDAGDEYAIVRLDSPPPTFAAKHSVLIVVEQFRSLTIVKGGSLRASSWDGRRGGFAAIFVRETLTIEEGAILAADATGFRGGARAGHGECVGIGSGRNVSNWDNAAGLHANGTPRPFSVGYKGEGLVADVFRLDASTPYEGALPNAGVDPLVNGGGGGKNCNGPGGGGGGLVTGGGIGGGDGINAGRGGLPLRFGSDPRLVMGGGGGGAAGDNPNAPEAGDGSGGGALLIRAARVAGRGTLSASGQKGWLAPQDGSGGGGAGGTIDLLVREGTCDLDVRAVGGRGGASPQNGPGGGGGAGRVILRGAAQSCATKAVATSGLPGEPMDAGAGPSSVESAPPVLLP